jgi:CheY-like chemotaxis protein
MKLRTLVVEDDRYQAEAVNHVLHEISEDQMKGADIDGFEITLVNCASEARKRLEQAEFDKKPFDLLLLDLGLPENPGENEKPEMGVEILRLVKAKEAARGIIVISVFKDLEHFVRLGADDFIGKPYGQEELQLRTLKVWGLVKERHRRKIVNEIMKASLSKLALYADKGISYRFGSCFSRFIQSVRHETEEMRSELFKQFNLKPDDDLPEPLAQQLATAEDAIKKARDEWKAIQAPFKIPDYAPGSVVVEDAASNMAEEMRPCMNIRLETTADQETRILSFRDAYHDNAPMIIRELVINGLTELKESDFSKSWDVAVKTTIADGMAEISFRDNFTPISADLAEMVTKGDNIPPRDGQWRAWGLSVVQHIALRGGGRLIVKPLEDGNLITYRVTLAQDV